MKSTTIKPDKSLSLICLAISSAASRFVFTAVFSILVCFVDCPELCDAQCCGLSYDSRISTHAGVQSMMPFGIARPEPLSKGHVGLARFSAPRLGGEKALGSAE